MSRHPPGYIHQGGEVSDEDSGENPLTPLGDVRIIALEQYGAGPFGSVHLAELGAEVIKLEDPSIRGHVGRNVPPYAKGEDSLFVETFNHNKRSLSLDVSTPLVEVSSRT